VTDSKAGLSEQADVLRVHNYIVLGTGWYAEST